MYVIIPARYASTRLPGKPLAPVGGKPLVQWVYDRAKASGAKHVVIATDDERIRAAAESFGAQVCMTATSHASGTERIGEVIRTLSIPDDEIVVNLQGDEPLMPPELIRAVAGRLADDPTVDVSTAACPITSNEDFLNPNIVKVVCNNHGHALLFSRASIPWPRDHLDQVPRNALRHIGIYGYRAGFVAQYLAWPPSLLEQTEQLEQLRILWHGGRIAVAITDEASAPRVSVDTPADLETIRELLVT